MDYEWKEAQVIQFGEGLHLINSVVQPSGAIDLIMSPGRGQEVAQAKALKAQELLRFLDRPGAITMRWEYPKGVTENSLMVALVETQAQLVEWVAVAALEQIPEVTKQEDGRYYYRLDTFPQCQTQAETDEKYLEVAAELRDVGWQFEDAQIEHDCISGYLRRVL